MRYWALIVILFLVFGQAGCFRRNRGGQQGEVSSSGGVSSGSDRSAAQVYLDKGKEQYRNDEDTQALESFQEAAKLDPELAEAHFRIGLAYDALGQPNEAEEAYKKAVESYKKYFAVDENTKDAEAHYNLGQTYAGLHLYSEAVREYRQATRLKEDDPAIYYDLGLALMKLAQYDEAAAAFSKSLELDPENYRAEDELAEAKEGVQRIRAGRKHQEDLLKKQKEQELKKLQEAGGATPESKPAPTKKPI